MRERHEAARKKRAMKGKSLCTDGRERHVLAAQHRDCAARGFARRCGVQPARERGVGREEAPLCDRDEHEVRVGEQRDEVDVAEGDHLARRGKVGTVRAGRSGQVGQVEGQVRSGEIRSGRVR